VRQRAPFGTVSEVGHVSTTTDGSRSAKRGVRLERGKEKALRSMRTRGVGDLRLLIKRTRSRTHEKGRRGMEKGRGGGGRESERGIVYGIPRSRTSASHLHGPVINLPAAR